MDILTETPSANAEISSIFNSMRHSSAIIQQSCFWEGIFVHYFWLSPGWGLCVIFCVYSLLSYNKAELSSANQWQFSLKVCGKTPVKKQKTTRCFQKVLLPTLRPGFWTGRVFKQLRVGTVRRQDSEPCSSVHACFVCTWLPFMRWMLKVTQLENRDDGICYQLSYFNCQTLVQVSWVNEKYSTVTV